MLLAIMAQISREVGKAIVGFRPLLLSWFNMDVTLPWLMGVFFLYHDLEKYPNIPNIC